MTPQTYCTVYTAHHIYANAQVLKYKPQGREGRLWRHRTDIAHAPSVKNDVTLQLQFKYNIKEEKVACDATEQTLRKRRQLIMTSHCCCCASTNLKEEKVVCDATEQRLRMRRGFKNDVTLLLLRKYKPQGREGRLWRQFRRVRWSFVGWLDETAAAAEATQEYTVKKVGEIFLIL
jgi:hypothetical protein